MSGRVIEVDREWLVYQARLPDERNWDKQTWEVFRGVMTSNGWYEIERGGRKYWCKADLGGRKSIEEIVKVLHRRLGWWLEEWRKN